MSKTAFYPIKTSCACMCLYTYNAKLNCLHYDPRAWCVHACAVLMH